MKKWYKTVLWVLVSSIILLVAALSLFIYKVKFGLPFYETKPPILNLQHEDFNILLFSKTNAYNHSSAIEASIPVFSKLAKENKWKLYKTDKAGVFNRKQLSLFDVVIWNNTSGRVLKTAQRESFKNYIEKGGAFLGLHAAGDNSHHWNWYYDELIAARFSHHPIKNQIQYAQLSLTTGADSLLTRGLPPQIHHSDEWYIFYENPSQKGAKILYAMNGELIDTNGNTLWLNNKSKGMGKVHPNIWYRKVKKGRAAYSALGHTGDTYKNKAYVQVLESLITWLGTK